MTATPLKLVAEEIRSALPYSFLEERRVVKRRVYEVSLLGIVGILVELRQAKFTGSLQVNLSQGGLCFVVAEWQQKETGWRPQR